MEIASPIFRQVILEALSAPNPLLGSIVQRSIPFTDSIKRCPDVTIIQVTPHNRDDLPGRIAQSLLGPVMDN